MLYERFLFWLGRFPDYVVFLLVSTMMATGVHFFVPNPYFLAVLFFPLFLAFESMSRSSKFLAFMSAKVNFVSFTAIGILSAVALILGWVDYSAKGKSGLILDQAHMALAFWVIGALLGFTLVDNWHRLAFFALFAKRRLTQILILSALWSLAIVLFPQAPHRGSASWYFGGMAVGALLHKASRLRLTQAAAAYRRLEHIADAWPHTVGAAELEALKLLARGRQFPSMRFSSLRNVLESSRKDGNLPKRLALVSASVYRLEGECDKAIVEASVSEEVPVELVDAHLLLIKAMSLDELGKSSLALEEIKKVIHSEVGSDCPLANALSALKMAEAVVATFPKGLPARHPLNQILHSMDLRAKILKDRKAGGNDEKGSVDRFLGRFLEIGIPIKASFSMDILGYCHLAAGYPEEAGILFQRCIETDPVFSPAYLHLGDYFRFRSLFAYGQKSASKSDLWHATACYRAAVLVERNSSGWIHQEARKRLEEIHRDKDNVLSQDETFEV